MANKDIGQGDQLNFNTDLTRYVNVTGNVYALLRAAELTSGGSVVAHTNPLPVELINPTSNTPFLADEITGALVTIDVVHHETHEGEYFITEYSASVNNAASLDIRILPGAEGFHFESEIAVGGQCRLYLYENANINGGTVLPVYSMNRINLTHTAPFQAWHTPNVVGVGAVPLVNGRLIPGGTSNQTRIGGTGGQRKEWILRPATEYLLRLTNTSGGAVVIYASVEGYEG